MAEHFIVCDNILLQQEAFEKCCMVTHTHTDATKRIISAATQSINRPMLMMISVFVCCVRQFSNRAEGCGFTGYNKVDRRAVGYTGAC